MRSVAIPLFILLMNPVLAAESIDIDQMSVEELEALPEEQIANLPARKVFSKIMLGGDPTLWDVLVRASLYKRMYGFDLGEPPLEELIREYQGHKGFPQTGFLTVAESQDILDGNVFAQATPIYVGGYAEPYISGDYASVEGTWVIDTDIVGEQHAFPVNTSRYVCDRSWSLCIEFVVMVTTHDFQDSTRTLRNEYYMSTSVNYWDILDWSENEIILKDDGDCRSTTVTMNSKAGEVHQVTRNAGGSCDVLGTDIPELESPRIAVLKPGFDVTHAYFQEINSMESGDLSPSFQEAMAKFKNAVEELETSK